MQIISNITAAAVMAATVDKILLPKGPGRLENRPNGATHQGMAHPGHAFDSWRSRNGDPTRNA